MLKMNHVLSAVLALTAGTMVIHQANAASGTGTATATIVTPITISNSTVNLAFGKIAAGTGGTVTISTAGARSKTGGVTLVSTGSTQTAASFTVSGAASTTYAITLPADGVVTITDGTNTMAVDSFVSNPSATSTLSAGGSDTILVGGTLTVANAQVAGAYTGTFTVTVDYN